MKHRKSGRQLSRKRAPRKALMRNLATDLITKGAIVTTEPKGKELKSYVEKLVTIAKTKEHGHAKSTLQGKLFGKEANSKLLKKLKITYKDRPGGYLRLIKLGRRTGDNAMQVKIQWV